MENIIVNANIIKAAALFASKNPSLPILAGIHFMPEHGQLTVACTDSYALFVCETGEKCEDFEPFTIDAKQLSTIKAVRSSAFGGRACYIIERGETFAKVTGNMETWVELRIMEGKYPHVRRLLPQVAESYEPEATAINPEYLVTVGKAFTTINRNGRAIVATRQTKPNVFTMECENVKATAAVMPLREDERHFEPYKRHNTTDGEAANKIAQLEADKAYWMGEAERKQDDCTTLEAKIAELETALEAAQTAQPAPVHEWESKTLYWFDHEVEGARLCKKGKNAGNWWIKKEVATA